MPTPPENCKKPDAATDDCSDEPQSPPILMSSLIRLNIRCRMHPAFDVICFVRRSRTCSRFLSVILQSALYSMSVSLPFPNHALQIRKRESKILDFPL